jgi:hypothetical protein
VIAEDHQKKLFMPETQNHSPALKAQGRHRLFIEDLATIQTMNHPHQHGGNGRQGRQHTAFEEAALLHHASRNCMS